jgi:hypothetical protein
MPDATKQHNEGMGWIFQRGFGACPAVHQTLRPRVHVRVENAGHVAAALPVHLNEFSWTNARQRTKVLFASINVGRDIPKCY